MKRVEKYPETKTFHFYNANPKGRITGDCTFRAIATALDLPWNQVVLEMAELSCETGYAINDKKGIERYMELKGWEKCRQPRKADNTKYTGAEFCRELNKSPRFAGKSLVCNIGGNHIVCIKQSRGLFKVHDIWDSTRKCIGNYWIKS